MQGQSAFKPPSIGPARGGKALHDDENKNKKTWLIHVSIHCASETRSINLPHYCGLWRQNNSYMKTPSECISMSATTRSSHGMFHE